MEVLQLMRYRVQQCQALESRPVKSTICVMIFCVNSNQGHGEEEL